MQSFLACASGSKRGAYMSAADALALAWRQHQAGNLTAAEQLYRQVLEAEPAHGDALALLGAIGLAQSRWGEAAEHLQRAAESLPNSSPVFDNLGITPARLGRMAHDNLGVALSRQGKSDEAVAHFRQALRIQPHNATALNNLGHALTERTELDEAVACLQRAVDLDPERAEIHNNLGVAFTQLDR